MVTRCTFAVAATGVCRNSAKCRALQVFDNTAGAEGPGRFVSCHLAGSVVVGNELGNLSVRILRPYGQRINRPGSNTEAYATHSLPDAHATKTNADPNLAIRRRHAAWRRVREQRRR